jgi:hypothetical protein
MIGKSKNSLKTSIALVLTFCAALILTASMSATGIGASGIIFEKDAAPGEHISHVITVSLGADENATDFLVEVMDWNQGLKGQNNAVNDSAYRPYSAKGFLKVTPQSFHLDSGSSQKVVVDGDIPTNVGDGGRYAIISVRNIPMMKQQGKASVGVVLDMDTIVLLTISGSEILKTGEIESLNIDEPISKKQQNVTLFFNNTGNYHFAINVTADLVDRQGKLVARSTESPLASVLPGASRIVQISLIPETELEPGSYSINATVSRRDGTTLASKNIKFEIK